mmetsp:Transcript_114726/g.244777  ORF Transcript_114726/g.244777 Transcript_114726/m.244777 type:complete len:547 (-) Transcript_114726:143-1783(-)
MAACSKAEVAFAVLLETNFGDTVRVVGAPDVLGAWQPSRGLDLDTGAGTYPCWSGEVLLPDSDCAAAGVEYKFVVTRADGSVLWEPGANRCLLVPRPSSTAMGQPPLEPGICMARSMTRSFFGEVGPAVSANLQPARFGEVTTAGAAFKACESGAVGPLPAGVTREDSAVSTLLMDSEDDGPVIGSPTPCCTSWPGLDVPTSDVEAPAALLHAARPAPAPPPPAVLGVGVDDVSRHESSSSAGPPQRFWSGAARVPKPWGLGCEDAYFFGAQSAGVADGVSEMAQFAADGVDAAAYAAELMELAARDLLVPSSASSGTGASSSRAAAAMLAAEAGATTYGASTVTVLTLDGAFADVANLGDSGCMLLRPRAWGMDIVERCREQTHDWNMPYQLTRVPEALSERLGLKAKRMDSAADCERYRWPVQTGDLLLLYTDGVADNLFWHEIIKVVDDAVETCLEGRVPPETLAEALVEAARARSLDEGSVTPFSKNARLHRQDLPGGKVDDITVVAVWVLSANPGQQDPDATILGCAHDAGSFRRMAALAC